MRYDNNYKLGEFTLQRTGGKGGDAAYEKAIGDYPAFNYDKAIFNSPKELENQPDRGTACPVEPVVVTGHRLTAA